MTGAAVDTACLRTALERQWADFFWSHEDLVVFSFEDQLIPDVGTSDTNTTDNTTPGDPPRTYSLYERAAGVLQALRRPDAPRWAHHFFHYDHLTLVHRDAILDIGGWDTHILFYATDCDMYYRLMWAGYQQAETTIGHIFDVATVLDDVGALLRVPGVEAGFDGDPGPPPPSREREPVDPSVDDEDEDEDVVPTSPWQGPRRHRVPGRPPQAEEEWSVEEEGLDGTDARKREDEKKRWEEKKEWQVRKRAEDAKRREAERRRQEARRKAEEAEAEHVRQVTRYGETYAHLVELSERMASLKSESGGGRNMWQQRQSGGDGEPFHRDPDGFEIGLQRLIETGRIIFSEKWGHRGCDIGAMGYGPEDAWRLEHDWDEQIDGNGAGGPSW